MINEIKKEARYAFRSGKFIIILSSFLFFAILTPIMLKSILPMILSNQLSQDGSQDIGSIINATQISCIQSYMGDVFEIITIIIAFSLGGITASEIKNNTLIFSLCSGKSYKNIIAGKTIVFGAMFVLIPILALIVNYVYSGILFEFDINIFPIIFGGLLQSLYMLFLLTCLIMYGVISKNTISCGFLSLATVYGIHFISSLFLFQEWTPSGLLIQSQKLLPSFGVHLYIPVLITLVLIMLMLFVTINRLKHIEWNTRSTNS